MFSYIAKVFILQTYKFKIVNNTACFEGEAPWIKPTLLQDKWGEAPCIKPTLLQDKWGEAPWIKPTLLQDK